MQISVGTRYQVIHTHGFLWKVKLQAQFQKSWDALHSVFIFILQ